MRPATKAAGDASLAQLGQASYGEFFSAVKLDFTAGCIKVGRCTLTPGFRS